MARRWSANSTNASLALPSAAANTRSPYPSVAIMLCRNSCVIATSRSSIVVVRKLLINRADAAVSAAITAEPATANQIRRLKRVGFMADRLGPLLDQGMARTGPRGAAALYAGTAPQSDLAPPVTRNGGLR